MHEPYIKLCKDSTQLVLDVNTEIPVQLGQRVYNVNITLPQFCETEKRVGIEIFKVMNGYTSLSIFKREVHVPDLNTLDVRNSRIEFGKKTTIIFPKF